MNDAEAGDGRFRPVRTALLGAGAIAQVAHLPAYRRLHNVELVAICDVSETKLRALKERTGVAHAVRTLDELLAIDEVEAVDVCLPTHLHRGAVERCLEAGRHVLCEKPLAMSATEVEEVREVRERAGKTLLVGMNHRYRDDSMELKKLVEEGELGDVFYARAGWLRRHERIRSDSWHYRRAKSGGGVVMDLGIHLLDLLLWFADHPPPERVSATFFHHRPEIDVEDTASITLRCATGFTATVAVSWNFLTESDDQFLDLHGTEGSGRLEPLRVHRRENGDVVEVTPRVAARSPNRQAYMESYEREIAFFAEIVAGREKAPPLEEQLVLARVLDATRRSAREGREVEVASGDRDAARA